MKFSYIRPLLRLDRYGTGGMIMAALLICATGAGCASMGGRLSSLKTAARYPKPTAGQNETLGKTEEVASNDSSVSNISSVDKNADEAILPVAYETESTSRAGSVVFVRDSSETPRLPQTGLPSDSSAGEVHSVPLSAAESTGAWTFDDAIRATLSADPALQAGMAAIQEAHADWWTSSLPPNPELGVAGGTLPFKTVTPDAPGGPPQLDVEIAMPVDWFLFAKRAAAMESARIGTQISEAEYADLIRVRVAETGVAFYDLLEAKSQRALAEQDVAVLTKLESVIKQAQAAGGLPELDLKRVHLDLLQSRQALMESDGELAVARANLWARFGRDEQLPADFDIVGEWDRLPQIDPIPVEEAFEQARQNRPDIRALQLLVTRSGADRLVERRNAFPEVTPAFGYSHQYQECIGDPDYDGWNISLGVTVPVFDRNQGNRAKALAAETRSRWELQSGLVDLRAEVTVADEQLRVARRRTDAIADEQVQLAADVRDRIMEAYRAGGSPLIDVLNAENSYRETYRLYITSRADYGRALYLYNCTLGVSTMEGNEQ